MSVFVFICLVMPWSVHSDESISWTHNRKQAGLHPPKTLWFWPNSSSSWQKTTIHLLQAHLVANEDHFFLPFTGFFWGIFGFPALLWFQTRELKRSCDWFWQRFSPWSEGEERETSSFKRQSSEDMRLGVLVQVSIMNLLPLSIFSVVICLKNQKINSVFLIFHYSTCQQK